jgi:sec-independent protein translocase protein TatA
MRLAGQDILVGDNLMFARGIGLPELLIILTIILVLFGVGRVSRVGRELGTAISEFRRGLTDGKEENPAEEPKP